MADAPYEFKVDPQPEIRQVVCIPCGQPLDPADCCSSGCQYDTVSRDKRPHHTLEWHVFKYEKAEPWTVTALPAPPMPTAAQQADKIKRRPE